MKTSFVNRSLAGVVSCTMLLTSTLHYGTLRTFAEDKGKYEILNTFFDGEVDGEYAVNDTGKKLGDLFVKQTKQELGDGLTINSRGTKSSNTPICGRLSWRGRRTACC